MFGRLSLHCFHTPAVNWSRSATGTSSVARYAVNVRKGSQKYLLLWCEVHRLGTHRAANRLASERRRASETGSVRKS
ncbi:hypothetical protein STENM36S_02117 [Streptomyces tendae]